MLPNSRDLTRQVLKEMGPALLLGVTLLGVAAIVLLLPGCGSVNKDDTVVDGTCEAEACTLYCADRDYFGACEDDGCHCFGGADSDTDADTDTDSDTDADTDSDTNACGFGTEDVDCDGDVDGTCVGPEVANPVAYGGEPAGIVTIFATVSDPILCDDVVRNFHVYPVGYDVWWNFGSAPCFDMAPPPDYVYTREIGPLMRGCYEIVVVAEDSGGNAIMIGSNYADTNTDDTIAMNLLPCAEVPGGCP